ncbi:hypothetical protein D9M68_860200 [compost metagenome]
MLLGCVHHRDETLEALGNRAVEVLLREGLGGGGEYRDLFHARLPRAFEALQVGGQRGVGDAGQLLDLREDFGAASHLRHPFGRDEAADFHIVQAGGGQVVDQAHLVRHADWLFLVLQAVARADFDQADLFGQTHTVISLVAIADSVNRGVGLRKLSTNLQACQG